MKKKFLSVVVAVSLAINPLISAAPACNAKEIAENIDIQEYIQDVADMYGENVEINNLEENVEEDEVLDIVETEQDIIDTQCSKKNGEVYHVETYVEDGVKYVKAYSEDLEYVSLTTIKDDNEIVAEFYTKDSDDAYEKNTLEILLEEDEVQTVQAQDVRYNGSVVKTQIKGNYYYQEGYGYDSKKKKANGKSFLKIGCNYNYQIRTDNLTSSKQDKVLAYKKSIRNSNDCNTKAGLSLAGTGISLTLVLGLVAANIAFPPSVIVDIVLGARGAVGFTGSVSSAVYFYIDAFGYVDDAHDYYEIIKYYGSRI